MSSTRAPSKPRSVKTACAVSRSNSRVASASRGRRGGVAALAVVGFSLGRVGRAMRQILSGMGQIVTHGVGEAEPRTDEFDLRVGELEFGGQQPGFGVEDIRGGRLSNAVLALRGERRVGRSRTGAPGCVDLRSCLRNVENGGRHLQRYRSLCRVEVGLHLCGIGLKFGGNGPIADGVVWGVREGDANGPGRAPFVLGRKDRVVGLTLDGLPKTIEPGISRDSLRRPALLVRTQTLAQRSEFQAVVRRASR